MDAKQREEIMINVSNIDDMEEVLGKKLKNVIKVEMWSESNSGKYILAIRNASYVVFEKSPDDDVHDTPVCRYVASTFIAPEESDCFIDNILWFEHGGCVRIFLRDRYEHCCKYCITVIFDKYLYEFSERKFRTKNDNSEFLKRKKLVRSHLGKSVGIRIDRPIGFVHRKENYTLTYPVNYGFLPGIIGGDGENLDVYLLGVDEPVRGYTAKVIGIVHRENDCEDKLVAAPEGMTFTKEEIEERIDFQEKYYDSFVETENSFFECSMKECMLDRTIPEELEHHLLNKIICRCDEKLYHFPSWKEYETLDEFKPYRDAEESGDMNISRPEFICSPKTLFLALWRKHIYNNPDLSDKAVISLRFYFENGSLKMFIKSIEDESR